MSVDSSTIFRACDRILWIGFCLLILFLPFSSGLVNVFSYLIVAVFLIQLLLERPDIRGRVRPLDVAVLGWLLFMVVSIVMSDHARDGWKDLFKRVLPSVTLFYAFVRVFRDDRRLRWFLGAAIAGICVTCLAGLSQYLFGADFIRGRGLVDGRIQATMKSPTSLATYLMTFAPVMLVALWKIRDPKVFPLSARSRNFWRAVLLSVFLLAVFCLGHTYSRGGWLSFGLGMLTLAILEKRLRWPLVALLAVFGLYFSQKIFIEREMMTPDLLLNSFGRKQMWTDAWQIVQSHPLWGAGLNIAWQKYPHNCYLQMWAEIGVFGLLSFLLMQVIVITGAIQALSVTRDETRRVVLLASFLGYAGFLLHNFFDTFFYSGSLGVLLWMLMGLVTVLSVGNSKGQSA